MTHKSPVILQVPESKLQGATIEVWNKSDLLHPGTITAMQPARRPAQPRGPIVRSSPPPPTPGGSGEAVRDSNEAERERQEAGAEVGSGSAVGELGGGCSPESPVWAVVGREGEVGAVEMGEDVGLQEATAALQRDTAWEIIKVIQAGLCTVPALSCTIEQPGSLNSLVCGWFCR